MARVTVEDCLENVDNRFELVMLATKRSRQLATGGKEPKVAWENDKPTVVALREIAAGLVDAEFVAQEDLVEEEPLFAAAFEEGFAHRVQARQLGPLLEFCEFINRLEYRAAKEPVEEVMNDLLAAIGYEAWLHDEDDKRVALSRWDNMQELVKWLAKKGEEDGKNLIELTQMIALINLLDKQNGDERPDAVQLSTLHAAKGLEFKHVFLVGVEEGVLPHRESMDPVKLEEERRLMYVGITRAQRSLHISYAEKRKQGRDLIPCEPSRFIAEMGKEDLRFSGGKTDTVPDKASGAARLAAMKAMLAGKPG